MTRPLRVLFVSHDGYPAGATIFLLHMLRWFRAHADLEFDVALRHDGELAPEFAAVCRTVLLAPATRPRTWRERLRACWASVRPARRHRSLRSLLASGDYDLLYMNTMTLGDHLAGVAGVPVPLITHAHELGGAIRLHAHGEEGRVVERSSRIVCVSQAVRQALVHEFGCPPEKAYHLPGFVPLPFEPRGTSEQRRARLLVPLGIPRQAWVLGVCAHAMLAKGVDLAAPLLALLPREVAGREVHLVWVGSERPEYPLARAAADAQAAGVAGRLHFAGLTRQPVDWMSLFDLHLLLSREESYPLVVREAAVLGICTIAFRDAGGAPEFIRDDAGICTPLLDLPAMALAVQDLLRDTPRRVAMGQAARHRAVQDHAPDVILPHVLRLIEEVADGRQRR